MAYDDPDDLDPEANDDGTGRVTLSRDQIRSMERDAKAARAAQRELAFVKAGIDTDSPLGKMFTAAYEGPLDREAINTAWTAVAPAAPPPPADDTPPPAGETPPPADDGAEFERERQRLAADGAGDTGTPPDRDPRKTAIEGGHKMMAEGRSRDEAMAQAFSDLAGAAAAGDSRVIYNP